MPELPEVHTTVQGLNILVNEISSKNIANKKENNETIKP